MERESPHPLILTWTDNRGVHRRELTRPFTIGRTPENDIMLDAPSVSRRHCVVTPRGPYVKVDASMSTNGVRSGGQRVATLRLPAGGSFAVGGTTFAVEAVGVSKGGSAPRSMHARDARLPVVVGAAAIATLAILFTVGLLVTRTNSDVRPFDPAHLQPLLGEQQVTRIVTGTSSVSSEVSRDESGAVLLQSNQASLVVPHQALSENTVVELRSIQPTDLPPGFEFRHAVEVDLGGADVASAILVGMPFTEGDLVLHKVGQDWIHEAVNNIDGMGFVQAYSASPFALVRRANMPASTKKQDGKCVVAGFVGWNPSDLKDDNLETKTERDRVINESKVFTIVNSLDGSVVENRDVWRYYEHANAQATLLNYANQGHKIVLVGHSAGGAAALTVAEFLDMHGFQVALLTELDTFTGFRLDMLLPGVPATVPTMTLSTPHWVYRNANPAPPNVKVAYNRYQWSDPMYWGRPQSYRDGTTVAKNSIVTRLSSWSQDWFVHNMVPTVAAEDPDLMALLERACGSAPKGDEVPVIQSVGCPTAIKLGQAFSCSPAVTGSVTSWRWSTPPNAPSNPREATTRQFDTRYDIPGNWRITLTACNGGTSCDEESQVVEVTPGDPPVPSAPVVNSLGCTPASVATGRSITCNPSITGNVSSRSWSASGGSPSSGSGTSFSTSYGSAGSKTIALQACNGSACTNSSQTVTVQAPQSGAPTINSLGCSPTSVDLSQSVTCSPSISGTVTSRSWSAVGGSPSSGSGTSFSTSYGSAGSKTISLQACNASACSNSSQTVVVLDPGAQIPAAPSNVRVVNPGTTCLALSCPAFSVAWNDNSNNETGFRVYANGSLYQTVTVNLTNVVIDQGTNLELPGTACFSVSAFNGSGESARAGNACRTLQVDYSLSLDLNDLPDGHTFTIGQGISLCYWLTPSNVPYGVRLFKSTNGSQYELISQWTDTGGGDCVDSTVGSPAGTRTYLAQAVVNGSVVAEGTTWIQVVPVSDACRLAIDVSATATVIPTIGHCSNQACVVHIEDEMVFIEAKTNTMFRVVRGVNGTRPTPHAADVPITGGGC